MYSDPFSKQPNPVVVGSIVIGSVLAFLIIFAISTIYAQNNHDKQLAKIAQKSTQNDKKLVETNREINGSQAMIFAICEEFHRRDLVYGNSWQEIAKIEVQFKRPNNNPIDAEYHRQRRVIFKNAIKNNRYLVDFNCAKAMQKAYTEGTKDTRNATGKSPRAQTRRRRT